MKMKTILGLIGAFAVAFGIRTLFKYLSKDYDKKKSEDYIRIEDIKNITNSNNKAKTEIEVIPSDGNSAEVDMNHAKKEAAENISARHKVAEDVIKQSVNNIFNDPDTTKDKSTKNNQKIDNMFDNLKNM